MLVLSPRAGRHNIAEALQFRRLLLEGGGREAALLCAPGVPLSISNARQTRIRQERSFIVDRS